MNIDGWEYEYQSLPGWEVHDKLPWCTDKMRSNPESNTACLIYSIGEVRMGTEMGYLALFQDKQAPRLLLNVTSMMFPIRDPFYSEDGRYLVLKAQVYVEAEHNLDCPILFLNLAERSFAKFKMRGNNYNYGIEELSPTRFRILVDEYQKSKGFDEDAIVDVNDLTWTPFRKCPFCDQLQVQESHSPDL